MQYNINISHWLIKYNHNELINFNCLTLEEEEASNCFNELNNIIKKYESKKVKEN